MKQDTYDRVLAILEKSQVKPHTRKLKSGAVVNVKGYTDKRSKKTGADKPKTPTKVSKADTSSIDRALRWFNDSYETLEYQAEKVLDKKSGVSASVRKRVSNEYDQAKKLRDESIKTSNITSKTSLTEEAIKIKTSEIRSLERELEEYMFSIGEVFRKMKDRRRSERLGLKGVREAERDLD